ncbi:MAG: hypothetical protein LBP59_08070 [Planctomycetaceae bacterium]|nr:hypothetical protein [Planctomycetaceae bacterium]
MREVDISTAFLFALRQSAGGTPAIRWSRLYFRIAGDMPAKKRNADAKGSPSPPDRGRPACMRLYSTALSEVDISTAFLFAYRQSAGETPAIRWSRLQAVVRNR